MDTGDTAWMLASSALVLLMTPGLAFFYGGMVRSKSVLNMMMMSVSALGLIGVLWVLYGYSMAFGADIGGGLLGNPGQFLGLQGTFGGTYLATEGGPPAEIPLVGTIPATVFVAFQAMFAIITVALISGAAADRLRFGPWLLFAGLWATIVYFPVAHWVFAFDGVTAGADSTGGWIANQLKAIDFAGGTAVHINAGAAALALCLVLGKRPRVAEGADASAQPDPGDAGCRAAVVRLVRLQRRIGGRLQRHRRDHVRQHPGRHLGRHARLAPGRARP